MKTMFKHIKTGFFIGVGITLALSLSALLAQSMYQFSSGEVISSSKINENFAVAAPAGLVAAFYLSACPTGWVAADGDNSTPDLRGRFIRGMDDMNGSAGTAGVDPDGVRTLGDPQGDLYGSHTHSGTVSTRHGSAIGAYTYNYGGAVSFLATINHTLSINASGGAETRPKNVALIFCMRQN